MADFTSADDELQHLQQLDRASEQLVQNLEGMLNKFKVLNEGAKASAQVIGDWEDVIGLMSTQDLPGGFVAVPSQ